jgi:hypothetical protein
MKDPLLSRYGPNTHLVERFFGRVRMLPIADLDRAVKRWRETAGPEYHAAERALNRAIAASGRHAEQARVFDRMHEVIRRRWFSGRTSAEERESASSASYVVATALYALLAVELLGEEQFARLYAPVAEIVPVRELSSPTWQASASRLGVVLDDATGDAGPAPSGARGIERDGRPASVRDVGPRLP